MSTELCQASTHVYWTVSGIHKADAPAGHPHCRPGSGHRAGQNREGNQGHVPEDTPHHLPGKGREMLVWLEYGKGKNDRVDRLSGLVGWLVGWLVEFNVQSAAQGCLRRICWWEDRETLVWAE